MGELISGKEALIALANGEDVQKRSTGWAGGLWLDITEKEPFNLSCFFSGINRHGEEIEFRIKPKTITLNGIEVPTPFEPKEGKEYYYLNSGRQSGYAMKLNDGSLMDMQAMQFGAWRTEKEIKQVVTALRSIFKGE